MKKSNLTILAFLVTLIFSIQQINAFPYKEKDIKNINKPESHPIALNVSHGEISHSDNFVLSTKQLQNIVRAEKESDMNLEKWMFETNDALWQVDSEEPLKLEYWMLDPSDWLCKSPAR